MNQDLNHRLARANPFSKERAEREASSALPSAHTMRSLQDTQSSTPASYVRGSRQLSKTSAAVGLALGLVLGGAAVGTAAASTEVGKQAVGLFTGSYSSPPDSRELPPAEGELLLNTSSPEIIGVVDKLIDEPEPPAGWSSFDVLLPRWAKTVSVPPGMSREVIYRELLALPKGEPGTSTKTSLAASVEYAMMDAWYRYWLQATPRQRHELQKLLDSFQDLPNIWRNEQVHWDMPGNRMVLVARVAEAARHGDDQPMRQWLRDNTRANITGEPRANLICRAPLINAQGFCV